MSSKKIALITGANKGIGLETARQLGQQGITVLVGARDETKSDQAAKELREAGLDAHGIVLDVSNSGSIQKAAAQIERDYGRLDILVNNAGVMLDDQTKKAERTITRYVAEDVRDKSFRPGRDHAGVAPAPAQERPVAES